MKLRQHCRTAVVVVVAIAAVYHNKAIIDLYGGTRYKQPWTGSQYY